MNQIFSVEPIGDEPLVTGIELNVEDILPERFNLILLRTATTKPYSALISGDGALVVRKARIQYLKIVAVSILSAWGKAVPLHAPSLDPTLWKEICQAIDCSESADPY